MILSSLYIYAWRDSWWHIMKMFTFYNIMVYEITITRSRYGNVFAYNIYSYIHKYIGWVIKAKFSVCLLFTLLFVSVCALCMRQKYTKMIEAEKKIYVQRRTHFYEKRAKKIIKNKIKIGGWKWNPFKELLFLSLSQADNERSKSKSEK